MDVYSTLLSFWDSCFKENSSPFKEQYIDGDYLINILKKHLKGNVLDLGSGSGWGLYCLYLLNKNIKGIGLDPSLNGVRYANKNIEHLKNTNIQYMVGDESKLIEYQNYFNFVWSVNLFDVIPDDIIQKIVISLHQSMKPHGIAFISLNPPFSEDDLIQKLGMTKKGHYFYKDNILRGNIKNDNEWVDIFSSYFDILDKGLYTLNTKEPFKRRFILLRKK